jgi:D-alanyl-D-alanine carboxypeptidase
MKPLTIALVLICAITARADRFDDFIKAKMEEQKIPGVQFAVIFKGNVVMSRSYGLADLDSKKPVTKETPFQIASVSKPFVSTAAMMLWEQGKFKLEDPIGKYITDMPLAWSRVPIRNLLSHTSGVPEYRGGSLYAKHRMEETAFSEITKATPGGLVFDVGDHFAYSNTNYLLLGLLIESLTGKPYTDYLQTQILDRLGMTATGFIGKKEHAQGYLAVRDGFYPMRGCSLTWAGPGGGIVSTAEDLGKFDAALQNQTLIKNATLQKMLEPTPTRLGLIDYGFGWQTGRVGKTLMMLHSGKMNGFSSMFLRLPNERISVILLTNAEETDGNTLTRGILGLYLPEMDPQKLTPTVDDDPDTTRAHLKILLGILAVKPDMDVFTDDYKAHVGEEKLKAIGAELTRGGPIQPLQVLRRFKKNEFNGHSYLMKQGQTEMIVTLFINDKGKVAGLTITAP